MLSDWPPDPESPPWWLAAGIAVYAVGLVALAGVLIGAGEAWIAWIKENGCGL